MYVYVFSSFCENYYHIVSRLRVRLVCVRARADVLCRHQRRGPGRRVRRQVPEPVLAEEGRAVHGPVHDVLRQVPGLRAVGPVRQQGRVPLLQGHEVPQDPAPQVPLGYA